MFFPMEDGGIRGGWNKLYRGDTTPLVIVICIAASMGGLLLGYESGISGGVGPMDPYLERFFPSVYKKEKEYRGQDNSCVYDNQAFTIFKTSLYLAAAMSSLLASTVTRRFGRKLSMLFGGLFFCTGALLSGFAHSARMLIFGRLFLGFGIGFANQSVPIYLSEMAPYKHRGALHVGFQLSITTGFIVASILKYSFDKMEGGWGWRLSLGGAVIPGLILTIASLALPDTPNSMIERGKMHEARVLLERIRGGSDVDEEYNDLVAASKTSKDVHNPWRTLFNNRCDPHFLMAIVLGIGQHISGLNVVVFYAPVYFAAIGFGSAASLATAVVFGVVYIIGNIVAIYGADKWGRKYLICLGGNLMVPSLMLIAIWIWIRLDAPGEGGELGIVHVVFVLLLMFVFVGGYALSIGPLGWLVPSESFPLEFRSAGQSLFVAVSMITAFIMAHVFVPLLCATMPVFIISFGFFVFVITAYSYAKMPETANVPIEKIWGMHYESRNKRLSFTEIIWGIHYRGRNTRPTLRDVDPEPSTLHTALISV